MKYENYEEAKRICDEIKKHENSLKELDDDGIKVKICSVTDWSIYMISPYNKECPHEYSEQATWLVTSIKSDLESKISSLKETLDTL